MLRIKEPTVAQINTTLNDTERRIRRLEDRKQNVVSGYTVSYDESSGKLKLINGDIVITFTKDA